MLISACMIVKNEEEMLKATLPYLARNVDEIILVDTGSTDSTKEIAKEFGAKIYDFTWVNDFSAARNESLKHAKGEWILSIDADEVIADKDFVKLKTYLKTANGSSVSFDFAECRKGEFQVRSLNKKMKLFKNNMGYHYEKPIHEQICDVQGHEVCGEIYLTGMYIYHWGNMLDESSILNKKERNLKILREANMPKDFYYYFMLGQNLKDLKKYEEAIAAYAEALNIDKNNRLAALCYANSAWCYYEIKDPKNAFRSAFEATKLDQEDKGGALVVLSTVCLTQGLLKEAECFAEESKNIKISNYDGIQTSACYRNYYPNYLLGMIYSQKGDNSTAKKYYETAQQFENTIDVQKKLEVLK